MIRYPDSASTVERLVVGDQKVAISLYPKFEILPATFWNTNNGEKQRNISYIITQYTLLITQYTLLITQYTLLNTQYTILNT